MTKDHKDSPAINKFIHPPILALLYIAAAYLIGSYVQLTLPLSIPIKIIGVTLIVIALVFSFGAFNEFNKSKTTLDPHGTVTSLVTNGVYRFSRNPIYLGFLLMVVGFPLNYGYYSGAILSPFFLLTMNQLVIEKEEAYLEKKFGNDYTSYKSKVRRWL